MEELIYVVNHVFLPIQLPHGSDQSQSNDGALCRVVLESAQEYHNVHGNPDIWEPIIKMLRNFEALRPLTSAIVARQFSEMRNGGTDAFSVDGADC